VIPAITGTCPSFTSSTIDFGDMTGIQMEVGPLGSGDGALLFYWHGTGGHANEVDSMIPSAARQRILDAGGIIISPDKSGGVGSDCSGTSTFSTGDINVADQLAACAVRDYAIDPHRIYTTGCSAGALQAGCMAITRSSYVAASAMNSGGEIVMQTLQDPTHVPAVMTMHGDPSTDVVVVNFADASHMLDTQIKQAGGYEMDCNHGGGHCGAPANLYSAAIDFLLDHPFGISPEPYAGGIPSNIFPSYCQVY
jgi:poly(3-hydroxybutyrate) depolymerase